MLDRVHNLSLSGDGKWEAILEDPYQLLDMAFDAWYERIDKGAWEMTDRARRVEMVRSVPSNPLESRC